MRSSRASAISLDVSASPTVISANSSRAITAKITPGPARRVPRMPPSKATAVSTTPSVATAAPSACTDVSDSPRTMTARTTVSPPYAATTPLTSEIGPIRRPVKYDRYAPAPTIPSKPAISRTSGSDGGSVPRPNARATSRTALTTWMPAVTLRLPSRRLASALATSIVPHDNAAPSPARNPKEIGIRGSLSGRPPGQRHSTTLRDRPAGDPVLNCATARGDVAQLGEHRVRIAGVRGSSPSSPPTPQDSYSVNLSALATAATQVAVTPQSRIASVGPSRAQLSR